MFSVITLISYTGPLSCIYNTIVIDRRYNIILFASAFYSQLTCIM
jgi:hypothetical protein